MIQPALEFKDVFFSYPDGVEALRGISLSIAPGEKTALLGLNGSGKSTLLLHTNALLLPDSGTVTVDGIITGKKSATQVRRKVGMVFQDADDQLFMPTVEADIAFGPKNMGLDNEEIARRVDEALRATGIEGLRHRAPFQLSGGQKRMAAIATVLSMHPSILVMDEPTSGLDYEARERFVEIVGTLPHTLIMSTHETDLIHKLCTRAIVIREGKVVYDGPTQTLIYP